MGCPLYKLTRAYDCKWLILSILFRNAVYRNINWDNFYSGKLYDLQIIINYNSDSLTAAKAAAYGSNRNQIAVARILKVYLFSLLTNSYGDLPYLDALKADNGIVSYDSQENIYEYFFNE